MQFSDRQWNQIRAALRFWQTVTRESRTHPTEHRSVRDLFGDGKPTPLTGAEIEKLLRLEPGPQAVGGWPIRKYWESMRAVPYTRAIRLRMWRVLRGMGISPVGIAGATYLYRWSDLAQAAAEIRLRNQAFKEKYRAAR